MTATPLAATPVVQHLALAAPGSTSPGKVSVISGARTTAAPAPGTRLGHRRPAPAPPGSTAPGTLSVISGDHSMPHLYRSTEYILNDKKTKTNETMISQSQEMLL